MCICLYIRKIQPIHLGENKKEKEMYISLYIVKITLVKENCYLSIYIEKHKAIWGKKKRERDIPIYIGKYKYPYIEKYKEYIHFYI